MYRGDQELILSEMVKMYKKSTIASVSSPEMSPSPISDEALGNISGVTISSASDYKNVNSYTLTTHSTFF